MKKLLFAMAIAACLQMLDAQAQVKSENAAKSAVEKAEAATVNPKKNTKATVWVKYGKTLLDAYDVPAGNFWTGMSRQEMQLLGGTDKPTSEEVVSVGDRQMVKLVYSNKNLYLNESGVLEVIEVTSHLYEDLLNKAFEAYREAERLDSDGQKTKDISSGLTSISTHYIEEAYTAYSLGDYAKSSELFAKAADVVSYAPLSQLDTNSFYNAGFTAWVSQDYEKAKQYYEICYDNKYYGEDGEVITRLADIADKSGDKVRSKEYLEEGFSLFPQSQGILIGLINYYINNNEDPDRLFHLLDEAKRNEPNNASLHYVEGNIHKELGNVDAAIAAYRRCVDVDPNYYFGFIGEGILYYDRAVDIQNQASEEPDDKKYVELMAEFETSLKACIAPFEKAFELSPDVEIKSSVAEYLRNASFRFRTESEEYQAKYDKYSNYQPE